MFNKQAQNTIIRYSVPVWRLFDSRKSFKQKEKTTAKVEKRHGLYPEFRPDNR